MIPFKTEEGFTAVELLITLFVAGFFIIAGFGLYGIIIRDGGTTRAQTIASNLAYGYVRQYRSSAQKPCTATNPLTNSSVTVAGLSSVKVSVVITCPYSGYPTTGTAAVPTAAQQSVSEVKATVSYNNPVQTISNALYVTQ